jgi:hypothetical protein
MTPSAYICHKHIFFVNTKMVNVVGQWRGCGSSVVGDVVAQWLGDVVAQHWGCGSSVVKSTS